MARTTRSNKNIAPIKKTAQKTRSQKVNAKPKTSPKLRKTTPLKKNAVKNTSKKSPNKESTSADNVTKKKKKSQIPIASNKCQPNVSPRIFDSPLLQTYKGLQYTSKSSDSLNKCESPQIVVNGSRDLFATESLEAKIQLKSPARMVSIGIQCMLLTETQDVSVGTDETQLQDSGIQTSPQPSTFDIYTSVQSFVEEDLFASCSSEQMSDASYSEEDTSDDTLRNFDMLENYEDPIASVVNLNSSQPEENVIDELESGISDSPPHNRIYTNRRFHSPNSLQIVTKPNH